MVWDGLRPDSVTAADTPNLVLLGNRGVRFADNHSTYPTFTMMNAASFATGGRPAQTGFYGNTFWVPGATGNDATGTAINFRNPVFSEDYAVLGDVDAFYQGKLLLIGSLFEAAQAGGLCTWFRDGTTELCWSRGLALPLVIRVDGKDVSPIGAEVGADDD